MSKFLEPTYLNEKMVLNCAAYIWGGVTLESASSERNERKAEGKASLGIPFLKELFSPMSVGGTGSLSSATENKFTRRYTIGGMHMAVLDALREKGMLTALTPKDFDSLDLEKLSYTDITAVLRPVDFQGMVNTLKTMGPLAFQLFREFTPKFIPAGAPNRNNRISETQRLSEKYEKSFTAILERVEADYQTSKQLEMVMWPADGDGPPLGVVDLDTTDVESTAVRAKLTGGRFHIIGKVTQRIPSGRSLSLMQRTSLSSLFDIFGKLAAATPDQKALIQYNSGIASARQIVEKICRLEVDGPALRIAAMSVCM